MKKSKRIYFDYAAITPLDDEVAATMIKVQKTGWGNPSSLHSEGEAAKNILEEARLRVARILHCRGSEVFFTSGGTESLNIAILGVVKGDPLRQRAVQGSPLPHLIVSAIEHPAVLEPIKSLLKNNEIEVSFVYPDQSGRVSAETIGREIKANTVLVAVQHANNEIGSVQPIREISRIIKNFKNDPTPFPSPWQGEGNGERIPYLLVDACQSALYEDVSLERLGADMLVLDGIKLYGPRGAGILAIRHNVPISPVHYGGGQERGLRSGTENVANAVGLAEALEIAVKLREKESKCLTALRDYAIQKILKELPGSSLNGGPENRLPNNINICFPGQDSEFLVIKLDTLGFAVSAASACHTLSLENGSYVIESLGKKDCGSSSLRFTLGRATKKSDLDALISALKKIIK